MKKVVISVILVVIVLLAIIIVGISSNRTKQREILEFNSEFEYYSDKDLYGADVLTIINKAIDNNTTYNIEKNQEGFYIEDDKYSVKVELILLAMDDDGKIIEKTYQMETLEKAGLTGFISSFGLTTFECSKIEYNKTNRVNKVTVKQLEI